MRLSRSSEIAAGKAKDYPKARAIHDRLLPCYAPLDPARTADRPALLYSDLRAASRLERRFR
jgi:hypothetical protein